KIARGNLKPRLRMLVLYYFANKLNYLVAGTGNKSEIMMGYFTKYGDGGVDILPIGDLLKKDVIQLARKLEIPERIINKKPSAGLWPGQTDEEEMGITYKKLDKILESKSKNSKIENIIKKTEHKRKPPEICKL
ncbi:MAG: NAD(+) synthase, partial [Endomicrobiia bacterium]